MVYMGSFFETYPFVIYLIFMVWRNHQLKIFRTDILTEKNYTLIHFYTAYATLRILIHYQKCITEEDFCSMHVHVVESINIFLLIRNDFPRIWKLYILVAFKYYCIDFWYVLYNQTLLTTFRIAKYSIVSF